MNFISSPPKKKVVLIQIFLSTVNLDNGASYGHEEQLDTYIWNKLFIIRRIPIEKTVKLIQLDTLVSTMTRIQHL